jgi:hypothetical protein
MTTDIFDEAERAEFSSLGFTLTDDTASTAHVEGTCQVELKKWGPHHFHLHIVLPSGGEITGFTPRTRIVRPVCEDLGDDRAPRQ